MRVRTTGARSAAACSAARARPAVVRPHPETRPSRCWANPSDANKASVLAISGAGRPVDATSASTSASPFTRRLCNTASIAVTVVVSGSSHALGELEHLVLLTRVGPVLELDDAQLPELGAQPAVGGVEQAELLAVGHDLG